MRKGAFGLRACSAAAAAAPTAAAAAAAAVEETVYMCHFLYFSSGRVWGPVGPPAGGPPRRNRGPPEEAVATAAATATTKAATSAACCLCLFPKETAKETEMQLLLHFVSVFESLLWGSSLLAPLFFLWAPTGAPCLDFLFGCRRH